MFPELACFALSDVFRLDHRKILLFMVVIRSLHMCITWEENM